MNNTSCLLKLLKSWMNMGDRRMSCTIRLFIIYIGASCILLSCNSFNMEKYFKEQFRLCKGDSCMVNFAELPFDWDTLYYYVQQPNKVSSALSLPSYEKGFFFDKYVDNDISEKEDIPLLSSIVIFKLNGKTVFHESWYYYYYHYKKPVFLKSNKQIIIKNRDNASFCLFDVSQTYVLVDPEELCMGLWENIQRLRDSDGPLFSRISF